MALVGNILAKVSYFYTFQ